MEIKKLIIFYQNVVKILKSIFFACLWVGSFFMPPNNFLVREVKDGDTIDVIRFGKITKVRIYRIDSPEYKKGFPEKSQPYGKESKKFLEKLIKLGGGQVRIEFKKGVESYGRKIGDVFIADESLSRHLVLEGLTHPYVEYGGKKLLSEYEIAKKNRKGMFEGKHKIEMPSDFRNRLKNKGR